MKQNRYPHQSSLLIDDRPLTLLPKLAIKFGVERAVILQQIHWLSIQPKNGIIDNEGNKWVWGTYEEWQKDYFPFIKIDTLRKHMVALEKHGILIGSQLKKSQWDRTKYYRINMDRLYDADPIESEDEEGCGEISHTDVAKSATSNPKENATSITPSRATSSIYTKSSTKNTTESDRDHSPIQPLTPPKDPPPQIKPNEYLPGLVDNRKRKTGLRAEIAESLSEAQRLGVGAERFRALVDQVLDDLGKKLLADAGDDNALNEGREIALYLLKMSAGQQSDLFFTPKGISGIMEQWRLGWAGGSLPSAKQYKELASAMLAGKVTKDLSNGKPTTTNHLDRRSQAKAAMESEWERQYREIYGDNGAGATSL